MSVKDVILTLNLEEGTLNVIVNYMVKMHLLISRMLKQLKTSDVSVS